MTTINSNTNTNTNTNRNPVTTSTPLLVMTHSEIHVDGKEYVDGFRATDRVPLAVPICVAPSAHSPPPPPPPPPPPTQHVSATTPIERAVEELRQNVPSWHRVIAGATAGVVTSIFAAPFDVTKTRLAVQNTKHPTGKIYSGLAGTMKRTYVEEGIRGLYRGFGPTLAVIPLFWSVFFTCYSSTNHWLEQHVFRSPSHAAYVHMLSAGISGAITDVITNPLWVIRTRLQVQHMNLPAGHIPPYHSTWQALWKIRAEEGIYAWYKGLSASLLGLSHVMVQFPIYEKLKLSLPILFSRDPTASTIHPFDLIASASISKTFASIVTYPHEVLRARLQTTKYNGLIDCCVKTVRGEGITALYKGVLVNVIKTTPQCAVTFFVYESIVEHLGKYQQEQNMIVYE